MLTFKGHLMGLSEGGNITIKGMEHIKAAPIKVSEKTRSTVAHDVGDFFHQVHKSFHEEHGGELFGKGAKALKTGSAFSGSTSHLFDKKISDKDMATHKPSMGDLDVKVNHEHMAKLKEHLKPGRKFGNFTILGVNSAGGEHHTLIQHNKTGAVHQTDFEGTAYHKEEPAKFDQWSHSSHWDDTKAGIKGAHHKILVNAIGGSKHKFSIKYGLGNRQGENNWDTDTGSMAKKLFGPRGSEHHMESFHSLVHAIKTHIPAEHHQAIYDKFSNDLKKNKIDSTAALSHMRKHLNVKEPVNESSESVHHTSVVPMAGFSPISHMGHAIDLGGELKKRPGTKFVGISGKAEAYSPEERAHILQKQWSSKGDTVHAHVITGAGQVIRKAYDSLPEGKKVLHIVTGHDRASLAKGLKSSLEAGKIKEMEGHSFDEVHIHHPTDENREHGMSGTKMRAAAAAGDIETFHKHLGPMFSRKEAEKHMNRIKQGIESGKIPLKR